MAWETVLVERLRYYINDLDASPTWTDAQLIKFITIGAIQVNESLKTWISDYTINTASGTISPDPTTDGSTAGVASLFVLKAAEIIARAEIKTLLATAGFKVTDDRSTIDTTSAVNAAKTKAELFKDIYTQAELDFTRGNQTSGEAILAPYTSRDSIPYYTNNRSV